MPHRASVVAAQRAPGTLARGCHDQKRDGSLRLQTVSSLGTDWVRSLPCSFRGLGWRKLREKRSQRIGIEGAEVPDYQRVERPEVVLVRCFRSAHIDSLG